MEGGIGDHLCAIRFLPAIKELYPDCEFYGFSDTENNNAPKEIINTFWPSLFKEIQVIPTKKHKTYIVHSQFGEENYISAFDNIPDIYKNKMLNDYDKFYDLHIDALKWMAYDFNWSKYFFQFLPIEIDISPLNKKPNQLAVSLYSDSNSSNLLNQDYVYNLLLKLSKRYNIIIFATEQNRRFYEKCHDIANIVCYNIIDVVKEIRDSGLFLCIDSGLKFLGYSVGTPTFNFLSQIRSYGELPLHQYIRWNPFVWSALPLYYSIDYVDLLLTNASKYNTHLLPCLPEYKTEYLIVERAFNRS
jgi:ADP-heptose:LPS heptosyltransferase